MKKQFFSLVLLVAFSILLIPACKKKNEEVVNVFNWAEYISEDILEDFEKETGITVIYSTYDSNEAMYSKVKLLKGSGYDLIFPSNYYIAKMVNDGLLMPLDLGKLPNYNEVDKALLNQSYDKGNKYSVPFMWGITGIAVNSKFINPDNVTSWKDLWKEEYKGKVIVQNDVREVFHIALTSLGYSGNSTDPKEIEEAYNELVKLYPSIRLFNSDSPKVPLLNEEVYIGLVWGGEVFMAAKENPDIKFIYPKEGAIGWGDSYAMPVGAENVDNAYKLINFLLRPDISARISEEYGYASPSLKSKEFLPKDIAESIIIYPTPENMMKIEFQNDVFESIIVYEKFWEKLKTGS